MKDSCGVEGFKAAEGLIDAADVYALDHERVKGGSDAQVLTICKNRRVRSRQRQSLKSSAHPRSSLSSCVRMTLCISVSISS